MKLSGLLVALFVIGLSPQALMAEVNVKAGPAHVQVGNNQGSANRNVEYNKNKVDGSVTAKGLVRASELMSHAVYNRDEEQIGSINDVVLDTNTGKIKYVALSTGGFLGLGDALHAVPFKQFKCEVQDGERVCILNVANEQLENAEGFDQDNWPNMADNAWCEKNDRQYRSKNAR